MSKKITISDLSQKTGFSPATISRALNHKELVNAKTYETIVAAMKQLEYEPLLTLSIAAQALKKRILLVNVADASNSFYAKVFKGIRSSAANYGWYVMINEDPINNLTLEHFLAMLKNCNAIGLITLNLVNPDVLDLLSKVLPIVQCCEFEPTAKAPYIGIDNFEATVAMMDYLIRQGHKSIAILNGPLNLKSEQERQRGYEFALARAGISVCTENIIRLPASEYFIAYTAVHNLLQSEKKPDAIFAVADVLAYAAVNAAKEIGLSIPKQISIAGFDNILFSEMSNPKISTVNHPCFEIGFLSAESIRKQYIDARNCPKSMLMKTELILRESTR